MQYKRFKLRFRRSLKKQQRSVEDIGQQAERNIERLLFRRFERLKQVRRFVFGWVTLFVLLIGCLLWQMINLSGYYQTVQPVPGGIYNEGILGEFTNVNPIYATSEVDTSISRLLFAGLFTYNQQNQLVGDLASSYTVDTAGTTYTVHLKPHLTWQDGKPLTAADVVYTYQTIQDPDAQSPLLTSWQGITVKEINPLTVQFTLENPLASFPYTLTTGIIPKHILGSIADTDLRSANFNTVDPIGAGPFRWKGLEVSGTDPSNAEEQIGLTPFAGYVGGKPKLDEFIVHAYADQSELLAAFRDGQLTAVAGIDAVPADLASDKAVQVHSILLTAGTYVFFRTDSGVLTDAAVRQALVEASNPTQIIDQLGYPTVPVREPILLGQLAYNPTYAEQTNNLAAAQALLTQDGWALGTNGVRTKNGQPLAFTLVATDTPEYQLVTKLLKQQWQALGVDMTVQLEPAATYATTLQNHSYDATLDGISIGVDPDVFVYWDSSQADPRSSGLNLSDYDSATADEALEAGRTRLDPALRIIKYAPFLQAWQQDAPALGLYQPRFIYLTHGSVYGLSNHAINSDSDRFNNVQNWEVQTAKVSDS